VRGVAAARRSRQEDLAILLLSQQEEISALHLRVLLLAWAGWVFDFYDLILYSFLLIPIGQELALSKLELSLVLGTSLAATAAGGVAFGFLSDRFGRKRVLQWTILTYSGGTFLCGLAPGFGWLLAFRILTGIGIGGEWATGQTYVCETFPPRQRARYAGLMQTGAPIGIALAALVGGFAAPAIGWRACFLVSVAPALLVVWIRRALPESDLWLEHQRVAEVAAARAGALEQLLSARHRSLFLRSLVLAVLMMSAYWFTYSWLPGYLHEQRGLSLAKSTSWILVTQSGGLLGYASFGFAADALGRRPVYSAYALMMALGLVMITVLWDAVAGRPALILGFMFLVGFGTGLFAGFGPLFAELFPTAIRNAAMGSAFNLARGVQFFTPLAIAVVAGRYGLGGGISLAALFAVLAGLWIWTFPETRGRALTDLG
jgi:MFS family permease